MNTTQSGLFGSMNTTQSGLLSLTRDLVDSEMLPGMCYAVLRGGELVDSGCAGWADREQQLPLRPDHIFRAYSNTKLITSCAVLLMMERGHFALDDPIKAWIPELARLPVLRPGATTLDDTQPAQSDITIRQLLCHTAGFSHGVFDVGSLLHTAYQERGVRRSDSTLAELMTLLGGLPLQTQPGCAWAYALGCDILARLIEIVSGQRYGDFLHSQILTPLGMVDTGYVLRPDQRQRFTALYGAADAARPMGRGIVALHDTPYAGAWERAVPRQSGAGGLFTTLADMLALLRGLLPGGARLLRSDSVAQMMRNQRPPEMRVQLADGGPMPGMGFGLAGAVTIAPSAMAGEDAVGEMQWGGLAGTHWWIAPNAAGGKGLAGALMTHRMMAFWHPFWFDFKRRAHAAYAANED